LLAGQGDGRGATREDVPDAEGGNENDITSYAVEASMLRIANLEFAIVSCRLEAYCRAENMQWDIQVECAEHRERKFHGHAPTLSMSLFETSQNAFRRWPQLAPREVRWIEKNDTDVTPSGTLYIFEHTPIFQCYARCFDDAGKMHVKLDGKCDVYFDEHYGKNLSLHVDSSVVFRGVWFGRQPESECKSEIARFLNPDDFEFITTVHGVSMLIPK
jgi:hypothetical protein